eukprot:406471-Rhodomonas_salina.2
MRTSATSYKNRYPLRVRWCCHTVWGTDILFLVQIVWYKARQVRTCPHKSCPVLTSRVSGSTTDMCSTEAGTTTLHAQFDVSQNSVAGTVPPTISVLPVFGSTAITVRRY